MHFNPSTILSLFIAFAFASQCSVRSESTTDVFGSGTNSFSIEFLRVSDGGNAFDDTGFGGVSYEFRISKFEIGGEMIRAANNLGSLGLPLTFFPLVGISNMPAASMSWNNAARFVNWLNVSEGYAAAYKFTIQPGESGYDANSNIELWQVGDIGYDPNNQYRNANAYYFLPSENEWYKAAYFNPAGSNYFNYATSSDVQPASVSSGTNADTAVYGITNFPVRPAPLDQAGGLSPYGTMAQSGNVWEWTESSFVGTNTNETSDRTLRGGGYNNAFGPDDAGLSSVDRVAVAPSIGTTDIGFRIASVPEPTTNALLIITAALSVVAIIRRRRRS